MYNSYNNNEKGVSLLIYYKVFLIFLILKGCQEGIGDAKNVAVTVDKEVLERESRIYGRSENRTLSKHEKTINRCALACCEEDVSLLKDRKKLFNLAREKADSEGYSYKKQRSRSKVFGGEKMDKEAAKRQKLVCDQRQRRTEELVEDMKSATDTIKLLELQRGKFVTGEKYLQAAEVVSQITEWRGKQRKLQAELSKLQKADARSRKYHKGESAKGRAELKTMERFIFSKSKGPSDVSISAGSCSSTESTSSEADVNDADMQEGTPSECCSAGRNVASSSRTCSTKSTSSEVDVNDVVLQEGTPSECCSTGSTSCSSTSAEAAVDYQSSPHSSSQDGESDDPLFLKAPRTV